MKQTLTLLVFYALINPNQSAAFDLKSQIGLGGGKTLAGTFQDPAALISAILPNVYIVSGLILFFLLLFGGFTIISSAGNTESIAKGKQTITGAIIGFVVIFASYWIIEIIQILTGIQFLTSPVLGVGGG